MKLFTPTETKGLSTRQTSDDVYKIAYLQTTLGKLQTRLNSEEQAFTTRLTEQRALYNAEKEKLQADIRELLAQVQSLEARKANALIPIATLKRDAQQALLDAQALLKKNEERTLELDELQELLTEKLDAVSTREQVVATEESTLKSKITGALAQADTISRSHIRLNEMLVAFENRVAETNQQLALRESSVTQREQKLNESINAHTSRMATESRALADREETLERGFKELNKLTNPNG
jgi:chromosome segregation ATPase